MLPPPPRSTLYDSPCPSAPLVRSALGDEHADRPPAHDDDEGPVEAAIRYATASQQWLYLTDDELTAELAATATPRSTDRLTTEVLRSIGEAREGLDRKSTSPNSSH